MQFHFLLHYGISTLINPIERLLNYLDSQLHYIYSFGCHLPTPTIQCIEYTTTNFTVSFKPHYFWMIYLCYKS